MVRNPYLLLGVFSSFRNLQVDKYEAGVFGSCPRVYCNGCNVVPCGRSDLPGLDTVKLFCPNCNDIYTPPSSRFQGVDGVSHFNEYILRPLTAFSCRCVLRDHVRTPVLPKLPRARSSALLETNFPNFHLSPFFSKLVLEPATICESKPIRRTEARCRQGLHPQNIRIQGQ